MRTAIHTWVKCVNNASGSERASKSEMWIATFASDRWLGGTDDSLAPAPAVAYTTLYIASHLSFNRLSALERDLSLLFTATYPY